MATLELASLLLLHTTMGIMTNTIIAAAAAVESEFELSFAQLVSAIGIALVAGLSLLTLFLFATNRKRSNAKHRSIWIRFGYLAFLGTIVILAVTSFASIIQFGHLFGYALLAHVAAAGAFVFLLLLVACFYLPRGSDLLENEAPGDNRWWLARFSAWLLVLSSIMTAGTMFISMLPILDTAGLREFAVLHRYAGVAVVAAAILHLYSLSCTKMGLR